MTQRAIAEALYVQVGRKQFTEINIVQMCISKQMECDSMIAKKTTQNKASVSRLAPVAQLRRSIRADAAVVTSSNPHRYSALAQVSVKRCEGEGNFAPCGGEQPLPAGWRRWRPLLVACSLYLGAPPLWHP
jgi:hypothetical protein